MIRGRTLLPRRRAPLAPVMRVLALSVVAVGLFTLGLAVTVLVTAG